MQHAITWSVDGFAFVRSLGFEDIVGMSLAHHRVHKGASKAITNPAASIIVSLGEFPPTFPLRTKQFHKIYAILYMVSRKHMMERSLRLLSNENEDHCCPKKLPVLTPVTFSFHIQTKSLRITEKLN